METPPATREPDALRQAEAILERLDGCITTFYPDYGYEWDKKEALQIILTEIYEKRRNT